MKKLAIFLNQIHEYGWYLLFFLVPLFFTTLNFELFEFNKMWLVYLLTAWLTAAWLAKMVLTGKFLFRRSFWDIPLFLFLVSQCLSFLVSIDRHTSFWGYYSRSHGGLASTISYALLYWNFVSYTRINKSGKKKNSRFARKVLDQLASPGSPKASQSGLEIRSTCLAELAKSKSRRVGYFEAFCFFSLLLSAFLVSAYAVAQRLGIDAGYWVQDVQNRVFSTLGQPNWLAAWLTAVIPPALAIKLSLAHQETKELKNKKTNKQRVIRGKESRENKIQTIVYQLCNYRLSIVLPIVVYLLLLIALLYTKSRSGLLGFGVSAVIFWGLVWWSGPKKKRKSYRFPVTAGNGFAKPFFIFCLLFLILAITIGTPWTPKITDIFQNRVFVPGQEIGQYATLGQGSESGNIRSIVWRGAIKIWKHHPFFGTGPETFAYSYYWYRPREHNDVSEWDFLYNKAHNEYLNLAATTGTIGLVAYLGLIGSFLIWTAKKLQSYKAAKPQSKKLRQLGQLDIRSTGYLQTAFLAGFVGILVTNFLGFSVVAVALLFFLYPAISFRLANSASGIADFSLRSGPLCILAKSISKSGFSKKIALGLIFFFLSLISYLLFLIWYADFTFAAGRTLADAGDRLAAQPYLQKAARLRPGEPLYWDSLAVNLATLASGVEDESSAVSLADQAITANGQALTISPYNLNFWKNRVRIFYLLAENNPAYNQEAIATLNHAIKLAPTDAKLYYNLALIQAQTDQVNAAIATLEKTIKLKPNYDHARYLLALLLEQEGDIESARTQLEYILEKINPNHEEAAKKLEELEV